MKARLVRYILTISTLYIAMLLGLKWCEHRDAQSALDNLVELSKRRDEWSNVYGPANMPMHINTEFGHFKVPLANIASRGELFYNEYFRQKAWFSPDANGVYNLSSFAITFWMPDGQGPSSEATGLRSYRMVDPVDLKRKITPLRPREIDRPDPSATHYVVIVSQFCPLNGQGASKWQHSAGYQGIELFVTGWGAGTFDMAGCNEDKRPDRLTYVTVEPDQSELYCWATSAICFAWINLKDDGVRALTYLPRDTSTQVPEIAAVMHRLLTAWRQVPGGD